MFRAAQFVLTAQSLLAVPDDGDFYAVVIGCEGYAALPAVPNAVADADTLAGALRGANYALAAMTDAALDGEGRRDPDLFYPRRANLLRQIPAFLPADTFGPGDTLLFFFTGHGLQLADGQDYLAPLDAPAEPTAEDLIGCGWLIEQLLATGAGHILFVADVCRKTGLGVNLGGRFGEFTAQNLPAKPGVQFAFLRACATSQQSFIGPRGGSVFADALSDALAGKAEYPATLGTLYAYVRRTVVSQTRRSGLPQIPALATAGDAAREMTLAEITSVTLDEDDDITSATPDEDDEVTSVTLDKDEDNEVTSVTLDEDNEPSAPAAIDPAATVKDLADAVEAARPGDTLKLSGTYTLERPLTIDKPLTLQGDGVDSTEVTCAGKRYVMRFKGAGPWTVDEVTFQHTGDAAAHVVRVDGGAFTAKGCRFRGARSGIETFDDGTAGGIGLLLMGDAVGSIDGCTCEKNGAAGLALLGAARGTAQGNTCSENEGSGILLQDQAQPTLDGNTCRNNTWSGVAYFGAASGTARNNTCSHNKDDGIYLQDQSQPVLEWNTCQGNDACGMAYFNFAAGIARNNTCTQNAFHGIQVIDQAHPILESNSCQSNLMEGLAYLGAAAGTARNNTCSGNKRDGIHIEGDARPIVENNTCRVNGGRPIGVDVSWFAGYRVGPNTTS